MKTFKNPSALSIAKCASCTTGQPLLIPGVFFMTNQNEVWKDIPGYEGFYQISNNGMVRSLDREVKRNAKFRNGKSSVRIMRIKGKILTPYITNNGYYSINLQKNNIVSKFLVHRIVGLVFIDNVDNKPQINHLDANRKNNSVNNLEWTTQSENMKHCFSIGNGVFPDHKGEKHPQHKLTESQVLEMRSLHYKIPYSQLAKMYGVSEVTVHRILTKRIWAHI